MKLLLVAMVLVIGGIYSQPPRRPPRMQNCTQRGIPECPMSAPFPGVSITEDEDYRYITTTTCPPYGPANWTAPNQACQTNNTYIIPKRPQLADVLIPTGEGLTEYNGILYLRDDPRPILGALGVWLNGVLIYGVGSPSNGGPSNFNDAVESEGHTVDECGGHASPTNNYHIHSGIGINSTAQRERCGLPVDTPGEHSQLLGWIFDGYGMYGRLSLNGEVPDDLDSCGGHTHMIDSVETYHYHLPDGFPWIIGCFRACPLVSNNPMEFRSIVENETYGCSTDGGDSTTDEEDATAGAVGNVAFASTTILMVIVVALF